MLCEVLKAWKENAQFTASLGDGSPIEVVGRPNRGVCEMHSTRGVENRQSTEQVLCEEIEPEKPEGDFWEIPERRRAIEQNSSRVGQIATGAIPFCRQVC